MALTPAEQRAYRDYLFGPGGPHPLTFNYPGDPAPYVPGWTPTGYPANAYDPVGADNGLFAPGLIRGDKTSEDAVNAWNAANLKIPPSSGGAITAPGAPTAPGASPADDAAARRAAIAWALMAQQSPGGMQGVAGYGLGDEAPAAPTTATPAEDTSDTSAPSTTTAAPPAAAPPAAEQGVEQGPATPSGTVTSAPIGDISAPAPTFGEPAPVGPATQADEDQAAGHDDTAQAQQALSQTTQNSQLAAITQSQAIADAMQNDPAFAAAVTSSVQQQAIGKAQEAYQNITAPPAPVAPPAPPAEKSEKGEPTAEEDAAALAAANAQAVQMGYMSPEGVPTQDTTMSNANLAAAPNISNVSNVAPNTSMSFAPAPIGPLGLTVAPPAPAPTVTPTTMTAPEAPTPVDAPVAPMSPAQLADALAQGKANPAEMTQAQAAEMAAAAQMSALGYNQAQSNLADSINAAMQGIATDASSPAGPVGGYGAANGPGENAAAAAGFGMGLGQVGAVGAGTSDGFGLGATGIAGTGTDAGAVSGLGFGSEAGFSPGPAGTPSATVGAPGQSVAGTVNGITVGSLADAVQAAPATDAFGFTAAEAAQNAADDAAADAGDDGGDGGDGGEGGDD